MTGTPQILAMRHAQAQRIGIIVSVASLVLIGLTLYSLHLQIKHTKLQLNNFDSKNKD
jgi:hypothetical protein